MAKRKEASIEGLVLETGSAAPVAALLSTKDAIWVAQGWKPSKKPLPLLTRFDRSTRALLVLEHTDASETWCLDVCEGGPGRIVSLDSSSRETTVRWWTEVGAPVDARSIARGMSASRLCMDGGVLWVCDRSSVHRVAPESLASFELPPSRCPYVMRGGLAWGSLARSEEDPEPAIAALRPGDGMRVHATPVETSLDGIFFAGDLLIAMREFGAGFDAWVCSDAGLVPRPFGEPFTHGIAVAVHQRSRRIAIANPSAYVMIYSLDDGSAVGGRRIGPRPSALAFESESRVLAGTVQGVLGVEI